MGPPTGDDLVAGIVAGEGSTLVRTPHPDELALTLADALGAELAEGADGLAEAIDSRLAVVEERTRALAALELHARLHADGQRHVVATIDGLRHVVERMFQADELVDASRAALRERSGRGTALAVHPETIRRAAAELTDARAEEARAAREVAIVEVEAAELVDRTPPSGDTTSGDEPRRATRRPVVVLLVAAVLAVAATVVSGSPLPLVLAAVAGVWAVSEWARSRDDAADRHVASDNLAAVSALTDRAYGGAALAEPDELLDARRRLTTAQERLCDAEAVWRGLVGPGVDTDALDDVLAAPDPRLHIGDAELSRTATVRAAEAHRRRVLDEWELAWRALDRPTPAPDEAEDALERLVEEGIEEITVEAWPSPSGERTADDARYEELAGGRTVDELRAVAASPPAPLVVLDEAGEIGDADLAARTAALPPDARVVVVAPGPGD